MKIKEKKRSEAQKRQEERNGITDKQQIKILRNRPGRSEKEVRRLKERIEGTEKNRK